jgi:hypothetical protein
MKRITSELLRRRGACRSQVALFVALGGDSLELTEALCLKHADKFDFNWAANHLLTPAADRVFERIERTALAEYERIRRPALAEYERIERAAWTEYERIWQPAWSKYESIRQLARAEYARIQHQAWADYLRIRQSALAEYERIERAAQAEYERIEQPALAKYKRVLACNFFSAWMSPENHDDETARLKTSPI